MTHAQADAFAREWIDAWNQRDVERVLGHYADELRFMSQHAITYAGRAVIEGKPALRSYWLTALERIGALRFTLDHVGPRACELMTFAAGGSGRIVRGEAFYGAGL